MKIKFYLILILIINFECYAPNFFWQKILNIETDIINYMGTLREKERCSTLNAYRNPNCHDSLAIQKSIHMLAQDWNMHVPKIYFYTNEHKIYGFQIGNCIFINEKKLVFPIQSIHFKNIYAQWLASHELAHLKNHDYGNIMSLILRSWAGGTVLSFLYYKKRAIYVKLFLPTISVLACSAYLMFKNNPAQEHRADLDACSTFSCADCINELSCLHNCQHEEKHGYMSKEEVQEYAQKMVRENKHKPCDYHTKTAQKILRYFWGK